MAIHRTCLLLFFFTLLSASAIAQEPADNTAPGSGNLPIGLTEEEKTLMHLIGLNRDITLPPVGPVRACPEWEESEGIFMLWSNAELIDELQKDNQIYIITENTAWWNSWLASNSIPTTNIHYMIAKTNSIYTRDYGPWFIWDGNQDFGLVDNIYNRVRPDDDVIPAQIALEFRIPFYGMDLIHTGGNYYTDGFGNAFSTSLVLLENPSKTKEEVHQIMKDYLGIDHYWNPEILYSIMHMDTFGKPLAPDTFIWGKFPNYTTPWLYCENALEFLKTRQSPYGWPYKIERFPLWPHGGSWTGYINCLQTNNKILTGKYYTMHDAEAKAIYEHMAPGYEVHNIDSQGTGWGDSIHCRTRNLHRGETIRIYPQPHWEYADSDVDPYVVSAEVIPHNATTLDGPPEILWTTTGAGPFNAAVMSPTGNPHEYSGAIPAQPHGTLISYYIHAEDMTGLAKNFPLVAPEGMFTISVEDDVTKPDMEHRVIHGLTLNDWPMKITCTAVDETGIPDVTLEFEINGVPQPLVVLEKEDDTFVFTGTMDGNVALHDHIVYRLLATDSSTPANIAASPPVGWNHFFVEDKNTVVIIERDETPDTGLILHEICDDFGLNVHYTTDWPAMIDEYEVAMICLGMTPYNMALSYSQANDLVGFLSQGGSAYMEGGNCWAQDSYKHIYQPYFGIASASSGDSIKQMVGVPGTVTEGMVYTYLSEWQSSDHLTPDPAAQTLITSNSEGKTVSHDTGTYRTVAASFQMEGLVESDPHNHIKYLASCYLNHLGINIDLVVHRMRGTPRWVTMDLEGDPNGEYLLFYAFGPDYLSLGSIGILKLDPSTLSLLFCGNFPPSGKISETAAIPGDPNLEGVEVYFQGYMEDTGTGSFYLTNRDRFVVPKH